MILRLLHNKLVRFWKVFQLACGSWEGFVLLASHIHNFLAYGVTGHEGKAAGASVFSMVVYCWMQPTTNLKFKLEVQICFFVCGHSHCSQVVCWLIPLAG